MSKWIVIAPAAFLVAFGLGCLNYTAFGNADHHIEWAAENNLPGPSFAVFVVGTACVVLGSGAIGFKFGARCSRQKS